MQKLEVMQRIITHRMVGIVRADSADAALLLADACIAGGINVLEIAFTTPDTLEVIKELTKRHGDRALLGAGTVLDPETARLAILAGAKFIISPAVNIDTIRLCNRYQVSAIPGAMTATEIIAALDAGADIVKVFPSDVLGPAYVKALLAPLPQAPLMPTGGVTLANLADWFASGAVAVGIGSSLTGAAAQGDYAAVTSVARKFAAQMSDIRHR